MLEKNVSADLKGGEEIIAKVCWMEDDSQNIR